VKEKLFKLNRSGMSLAEVSIALAILAVLAAGSGMVVSQTLKLKFNSEAKLSAIDYQDAIANLIAAKVSDLAKKGCDPGSADNFCDPVVWASHFGSLDLPGGVGVIEIIKPTLPAKLTDFSNKLDPNSPQQASFQGALTACQGKPIVPPNNGTPPIPTNPNNNPTPGIYTFCVNLNRTGNAESTTSLLDAEAAIVEVRAELLTKQSDQSTKIMGPQPSIQNFIDAGNSGQQVSINYRILWKRLGTLNSQGKFIDSGFYSLNGQKVVNISELRQQP
jgi:prepilin-type N-terminal cleavage/methylation domain-containing protein